MTREEAIVKADELMSRNRSPIKVRLMSATKKPERREWSVIYEMYDPTDPGAVIDGPIVVIVDESTGEARSL